jgi:hypothetical protein
MYQTLDAAREMVKTGAGDGSVPHPLRRFTTMGDKRANKDKQAKRRVKAVNKAQNDAVKAASLTAMVERKKK